MFVTDKSPHIKQASMGSGSEGHVSALMMRYQRELASDPELVGAILSELPPAPKRERVTIRTDRTSVDAAIARALALAVMGVESRLELSSE